MASDRELAWVAGIMEGEGTIRINKATGQNLGTLIVSVVNTDREIIDFLHDRWQGYMKPATGLRPDQRPAWVWVVAARRAAAFLEEIRPFVVTTRVRTKLDLALAFQAQKRAHFRGRRGADDEYREQQFSYYLQMRELNVRGVTA